MAKYKKVNSKEFKEVLTDSGLNFDIFGYDGILNLISIYLEMDSVKYIETSPEFAEYEHNNSDKIYHYLKDRGYYDRKN